MLEENTGKLSPVEAYLLIRVNAARAKDICKYIIGNLFYNRVLTLESVTKIHHRNDPVQIYEYIVAGEAFGQYVPTAYEAFFLQPYRDNPETKMLLGQFINNALDRTLSKRKLIKAIVASTGMQGLLTYNYLSYIILGVGLTSAGDSMRQRLIRIIDTGNHLLEEKAENDEVAKMLKDMGNLSLLLINPGNEFLIAIEKAVVQQLQKRIIDYGNKRPVAICLGCSTGCEACGGGGY